VTGYALYPEARVDLDEIWEFIRADNVDAAHTRFAEILSALMRPMKNCYGAVAIMHGRRSPRVMAAILRGRE
jgi:plasmid stabilization system protein ParE